MKNYLRGVCAVAACVFALSGAHAAGPDGVVPAYTYQSAVSSAVVTIVTVSTSVTTGATQMDNPTLSGRVTTEIQNIDASANLWCLITSTTPIINGGRKISAGSSWIISALDFVYRNSYSTSTFVNSVTRGALNFYCLSDGASGTKAAVTQAY